MLVFFKKLFFVLLCWAGLFIRLYAQDTNRPPLFEGCNDPLISAAQRQACSRQKIKEFIAQKIIYPDSAQAKGIEGLILAKVVIDEQGEITMIEILKGLDPDCNAEALRVLRSMPPFAPALENRKTISAEWIIPIRFSLKKLLHHPQEDLYRLHWAKTEKDSLRRKELLAIIADETPFVRDAKGLNYRPEAIEFTLIKGRQLESYRTEETDNWPEEIRQAIQKLRAGHVLVLNAIISDRFQKIEVIREFYLY